MTQQFGFRASRNLIEVENRNICWDNLDIDRRDLALLVGTSAAGVTEGDYFNCKNLTSSLQPQVSALLTGAASGLTAMQGKISKNGDSGIATLSGNIINNDRAYYNIDYDIFSASTSSFFSPRTASGYSSGAQYLTGPTFLPNLTISGFNFVGETKEWSNYFIKYRSYLRLTDSGSTSRFSPLYLAPPTAVQSNVLWLDGEFSTITVEDGGVRRWDDVLQRGSAAQGTSANRPTLDTAELGVLPAVEFDGSNDFLSLGGIGGSIPTGATLIVLFSLSGNNVTGDSDYCILSSLANVASAWRNGQWGLFTGALINGFPSPAAMPANGTILATIRASTAYGLELRLNGVRQSFISPGGGYVYSSAGNFVIGVSDATSLSHAFRGCIHSLALFDEVLSDAELNSQEEYFRWRYDFVLDPDALALTSTKIIQGERFEYIELEDGAFLEVDF